VSEELCVFAFRLAPEERDAIHKAAGPGKASRFVRTLVAAAARDDQLGDQGDNGRSATHIWNLDDGVLLRARHRAARPASRHEDSGHPGKQARVAAPEN